MKTRYRMHFIGTDEEAFLEEKSMKSHYRAVEREKETRADTTMNARITSYSDT